MRVGYVRVSTEEQNTARQVRQLDGVDVERTFTDRASGKDAARPGLEELLGFVRDGDTVAVASMDRLARNLDDLRRLVRTMTGKGVRVEFVKEQLVFSGEDSPMATLLLSVMGAFAEFERALILERQREGIAAAKARGAYTGRKPSLGLVEAAELRRRAATGESKAALAREYGISRETVYAYLRTRRPAAVTAQPPGGELGDEDASDSRPQQPTPSRLRPDSQPGLEGRAVDLSVLLDEPPGTWRLAETEPGSGSWAVLHAGTRVGVVRREATIRGRRGWLARLDTGVPLPAHGDVAAAAGSNLWRTRDLAAAAIVRQMAPQPRRSR